MPLFRTVGIDHSFYRPASTAQLAHYARQVPADFHFCSKVWDKLTVPAYAHLPRYGAKAGQPNPRFLDHALDRFLADLPTGCPYAVEIRNPAVLSPRYREILLAHQVAHT